MDLEDIRRIIKEENNELHDRMKTEVGLMIEPIRDTLTAHIKHDEENDKMVNATLNELKDGQNSLKSDMRIGRLVGSGAYAIAVGLLVSYAENLI